MILHKYIEAPFGLKTVSESRLKVSLPSQFNDPFECLPREIGKWNQVMLKQLTKKKYFVNLKINEFIDEGIAKNRKEGKIIFKRNKNKLVEFYKEAFTKEKFQEINTRVKIFADKLMRIICFSSDTTSKTEEILLWSHYTNNHSGLKLHFESETLIQKRGELLKMDYKEERATIDSTLFRFFNEVHNPIDEELKKSFNHKSEVWKYENEYRLFVIPNLCELDSESNLFFYKFNPKSLVRIDLGINCSKEYKDKIISELIHEDKSHIKLYMAELNPDEFKIDYEEILIT